MKISNKPTRYAALASKVGAVVTRKASTGLMVGLSVAATVFAPVAHSNTFASLSAGPTSGVSGVTRVDFGVSTVSNSTWVVNPLSGYTVGSATYGGGELFNMTTTGISGVSARPVGSSGNYWSIQKGETGTVSFGTGVSYYGFLWGSPDVSGWNTVTFRDSAKNVLGTYGGLDTHLNNNWGNTTYFNVTTGAGPLIASVTFTANQNAFEMDNHAFLAPIPEPETYVMMMTGLGLLGLAARRRRQKLEA
jgi:hypothetical protein